METNGRWPSLPTKDCLCQQTCSLVFVIPLPPFNNIWICAYYFNIIIRPYPIIEAFVWTLRRPFQTISIHIHLRLLLKTFKWNCRAALHWSPCFADVRWIIITSDFADAIGMNNLRQILHNVNKVHGKIWYYSNVEIRLISWMLSASFLYNQFAKSFQFFHSWPNSSVMRIYVTHRLLLLLEKRNLYNSTVKHHIFW